MAFMVPVRAKKGVKGSPGTFPHPVPRLRVPSLIAVRGEGRPSGADSFRGR